MPPALLCGICLGLIAFDRSGHVPMNLGFVRPFVAALRAEGVRVIRVRRASHYEEPGAPAAAIQTNGGFITVIANPAILKSARDGFPRSCSNCAVIVDGGWIVMTYDERLETIVRRILLH